MSKTQKEKMSLKEMLSKVNQKTVDLVHRGPLLKLLGERVTVCNDEEKGGFYVVRIPFADYGDLILDDCSLEYLQRVKHNLEEIYDFNDLIARCKAEKTDLDNKTYRKYCEWLAINAVNEFLYIGDYYEDQIA